MEKTQHVDASGPVPKGTDGRLRRELSSFGVLLLTLSCLSPVLSIYGAGPDVLQHAGSGGLVLFVIGIGFAIVWAVVYAEIGSAYPYAGGDYVGVGSILGPWAGFASLTMWAVTAGPVAAFQAKTIATYVGELTPMPPTVITLGSLGAATLIGLTAVRMSAAVTGIFLGIEMLAVVALTAAGFYHPARPFWNVLIHPLVLDGGGMLRPVGLGAMALAGVTAAYATCGGNQAIAFGEELTEPERRIGHVILLAGLIGGIATALPVISAVLGAKDLAATISSPAPFTEIVSSIMGPFAGRALSAAVALAIFNALIAQIMFSARLFFSLGRDRVFGGRVNRLLASVHEPSGAPRAAALLVGLTAAICCLLSSHLLLVFSSGLVTYSLALVCASVIIGRRKAMTGHRGHWRSPLFPLGPILGLCLAAAFAAADLLDADAGRPSFLIFGGIIIVALLWHHFVVSRRAGGWAPRVDLGTNGSARKLEVRGKGSG